MVVFRFVFSAHKFLTHEFPTRKAGGLVVQLELSLGGLCFHCVDRCLCPPVRHFGIISMPRPHGPACEWEARQFRRQGFASFVVSVGLPPFHSIVAARDLICRETGGGGQRDPDGAPRLVGRGANRRSSWQGPNDRQSARGPCTLASPAGISQTTRRWRRIWGERRSALPSFRRLGAECRAGSTRTCQGASQGTGHPVAVGRLVRTAGRSTPP